MTTSTDMMMTVNIINTTTDTVTDIVKVKEELPIEGY